ncbi:NAD(P)H-dependent oxidoreductase [Hoeflea sp. YIM 152468]|uniref:NAD(P)H-dependent oxidoreductase n=1 Tax=Hoeflea sp. YIM 152468 TaxID=3031759 RepID=UPI0023DAF550|nr:NAD(P)H-dependent oxidoreductase [Hoeflea sp. YIM 152468]MDF1609019.1 NAD(P)H-dependent oxidoreductase [Hoeflea sp. YIM 152468]
MRILIVYCHPVPESYCAAVRDVAMRTLVTAGHQVDLLDLYAEGFDPVMQADERRRYNEMKLADHPFPDHAARLKAAEGLLLVYPTWWYGLPAMLKGWFDRVWTPDLAFRLPDRSGPIEPLLTQIRWLGVITTCGAPRWWSYMVAHPGKRTILRGMRALCAKRCRKLFMAHYLMDKSTPHSRARFLARVEKRLARL